MQRILIGVGGLLAIGLIGWFGAAQIGHAVWRAAWVVPLAIALHAVQLLLSAIAWRGLAGGARTPRLRGWWRIRWVREAVNSLLPVAQMGGNVVAVRLLAQYGVVAPLAAAATTLDVAAEAVSQAAFTLLGLAALAAIRPDPALLRGLGIGAALLLAAAAAFMLALRFGLMHWVERLLRAVPGLGALRGLEAELQRLRRDRRAFLSATALHLLAWLLGVAETWLALAAMGLTPPLAVALVIECLGMAARSVGFAVPGALGVQESGFVLACGLFGIAPEAAVALSMVKRARELLVGLAGLLLWRRQELARTPRATAA